jgi:norsolorinic acid ketoreductase
MAAVQTLVSEYGISKLDIVIANAGVSKDFGPALRTPAKEMLDHFTVNTMGPLLLFQATAPLLKAASGFQIRCRFLRSRKYHTNGQSSGP